MQFEGIWYTETKAVKCDIVEAADADEASRKLHMLYFGGTEPARCLSVVPKGGYGGYHCEVNTK